MKNTSTPRSPSRRRLTKIAVVGMMAALPLGLVAAPAIAEPAAMADHPWQQDCDHTGPWQWQQNRGNWEWGNCDNGNGHWEWHRDHNQWQWHRDRDVAPAPPMFGSL